MHDFRPMREKSIDELEGASLQPPFASGMIARIAEARRRPIGDLSLGDLRLLVSQGVALAYVLPIALEHLEQRPLVNGELYVGDLLSAALHAADTYAVTPQHRERLREITVRALTRLSQVRPTDWNAPAPFDPDEPDEVDRESLEARLAEALDRLSGKRRTV